MKSEKMMNVICDEIDKIADKGITTANIDALYKLIDMYKDLKTVDAMEDAGYSDAMAYDDYPMSYRGRKRDAMGRYSRRGYEEEPRSEREYAEARYSQAKRDYRQSRAGKTDVMDSLNEKMREIKKELQQMSKESDFPEERKEIDKYVDMLDRMI